MEHPLDLSNQSIMDAGNSFESSEAENEDLCQFQNCSCPKKHLTILESPKVKSQNKNFTQYNYDNAPKISTMVNVPQKRPTSSETKGHVQCQPKRRKIDRNRQTLGRSASDTDLESQCSYQMDPSMMTTQPSFSNDNRYTSSQGHWDNSSQQTACDFYQKNREMENTIYFDNPMANIWRNKELDQERERSKTISHIERLPKKRACARNMSQDINSRNSKSSTDGNSKKELSKRSALHDNAQSSDKRTVPYQNDSTDSSLSSDDSSLLDNGKQSPSFNKTGNSDSQPTKELSEKEKAYLMLKADIINEIDNEKDDEEDLSAFRKNLFKRAMGAAGFTSSAPVPPKPQKETERDEEKPGESRITALDYLMSKQLLETEDKAFKPRNHHIHQIINGEKPGKLCLMDIVELQVEVGLA